MQRNIASVLFVLCVVARERTVAVASRRVCKQALNETAEPVLVNIGCAEIDTNCTSGEKGRKRN